MRADAMGFVYPKVDMNLCVDCGLCEKVCDFSNRKPLTVPKNFTLPCHAARHGDETVLARSQSGGAFTALSEIVLENGGVVYGAGFNKDFSVSHRRATTSEERDAMRGSKYVQSDLSGVFSQVKSDLESGSTVMFTGTPCQVAGLKAFLPKKLHSALLTVDFVCHGVPSPAVWKEYVELRTRGKDVIKADFRDKEACGWRMSKESFMDSSGRKYVYDTYTDLFDRNIMLRESCHACPYNIINRESDVVIADFWGIGRVIPELYDDKGTSMLICRTSKGEELYESAKVHMQIKDVQLEYEFMNRYNHALIAPFLPHKDKRMFEEEFIRKGFLRVARRWGNMGWRFKAWKLKVFVKKMIGVR